MLLIISNKIDVHADIVIKKLYERHMPFFRWNLEDFLIEHKFEMEVENGGITKIELCAEGRDVNLEQVSVVWYRRPGNLVVSREVTHEGVRDFCLREGEFLLKNVWSFLGDRVWINEPLKNRQLDSKLYQLKLASQLGLETPPSLVTNKPELVGKFKEKHHGEIIAKTLSVGYVDGDDRRKTIYTHRVTEDDLRRNVDLIKFTPTLFQAYVPKKMEFRVTVIEDAVFACAIESQKSDRTKDDWRRYDLENVPHYPYDLPLEIQEKLVQFLLLCDLKFGAFDLVLTPKDKYVFLEINASGQWYWTEDLTGLPITDCLVSLFKKYL